MILEPNTQKFLDSLAKQGGPALYELSIADARKVLEDAQASEVKKLAADIEDHNLACGPTGSVRIHIIRPHGTLSTLPIIMYFHGGGWILGDKNTHDRLIREIANGVNAAVVFVDYDRSPEAKYPVAIEQAYAATQYIAKHGNAFNLDTSRIVVAGDSAGGNIAAVVTLLAKERKGPRINLQLLFYPVTDANFENESYQQFADGYLLTKEAMKWFWDAYLPDIKKRKEPMASPLQASTEQLQGLPAALIMTGECDVLRDEGEAYAHKLIAANVHVTAMRFLGTIHDFVMLNALSETPATRSAVAHANYVLRAVFVSK